MLAGLGEDRDLLDGIDAEVGLEIEVELEHVVGVAGPLDQLADQHRVDLLELARALGRARAAWSRSDGRASERHLVFEGHLDLKAVVVLGRQRDTDVVARAPRELVDEVLGDFAQRVEVAQLERGILRDAEVAAGLGEDRDLLDRVDPEVGLEIEVGLEHLARVAGPLDQLGAQDRLDLRIPEAFGRRDSRLDLDRSGRVRSRGPDRRGRSSEGRALGHSRALG